MPERTIPLQRHRIILHDIRSRLVVDEGMSNLSFIVRHVDGLISHASMTDEEFNAECEQYVSSGALERRYEMILKYKDRYSCTSFDATLAVDMMIEKHKRGRA